MPSHDTLLLLTGLGVGATLGGITATIICSIIYSRSLKQISDYLGLNAPK